MNKLKKNNFGFTLMELMVVTAILVVLLVIVVANFRAVDFRSSLDNEAEKLAAVLRQAQIWALTGQTISGARYSFGIHLEECASGVCNYILFVDLDGDNVFDSIPDERYGQGDHNMVETIYLADNALKLGSSWPNSLDIVFEPPLATTYFNNSQTEATAEITLSSTYFSGTRKVVVDRESGQINMN